MTKLDLRKVYINGSRRPATLGVMRQQQNRSRKPVPLRTRRRRVQALMALGVFLALGAAGYAISYVSYLPQFNISTVTVAGTKDLPSRLIQAYIETLLNDGSNALFSKTTILSYGPTHLEKKTEQYFLRTKDVAVTRNSLLANAITVTVRERIPYATWCGSVGDCYLLDETGFLFAPVASTTPPIEPYVFYGGIQGNPLGQQYISAHFPGVVALLRLLGQAGFRAHAFTMVSDKDFTVSFVDGFSMRASFGQDASTLTQNLSLVMGAEPLKGKASKLEYVDLRFGDRVYYKFQGEVDTSTSSPRR